MDCTRKTASTRTLPLRTAFIRRTVSTNLLKTVYIKKMVSTSPRKMACTRKMASTKTLLSKMVSTKRTVSTKSDPSYVCYIPLTAILIRTLISYARDCDSRQIRVDISAERLCGMGDLLGGGLVQLDSLVACDFGI